MAQTRECGHRAVALQRCAYAIASFLFLACIAALSFSDRPAAAADALYEGFRHPPRSCSLMPYWYWNGRITPDRSRTEIEEMIHQGVYQAVLFPWDGMEVRYLSEDYFRQVGAALDIAAELGFTLNLADEYDWPSGHAWDFGSDQPELSRVLQQHPDFRMRRLDAVEHAVEGPQLWTAELAAVPEVVVAARQDAPGTLDPDSVRLLPAARALRWEVPAGRWLITVYTLIPAVGGHNTRVDLLNPNAVRCYLDLVYEEYARRFPQHLGRTLKLTLADHEGAYGVPIAWTPALWAEFEKRKGYDLRPLLPLLDHQTLDPVRGRKLRRDYLDEISELYANAFTRQVADWCGRHRLQHATSLYEEQIYIQVGQAGDMFQHWRAGSLVEIDALLERARMPIDFKEAVSVAHLDGKPLVVENQGLQGHATFFSLEKARLGTNMCLLWGANLLVPYSDYDQSKLTWPPQWFLSQPFRPYFHRYADYVRRAQFMNGQGSHVATIAIYYPLETAFANSETLLSAKPHRDLLWNNSMDHTQNLYTALQLELARGGWDYHVLDREYLRRAEIRDGALRLRDEQFRVLILPPMTDMEPAAIRQVLRFLDSGGAVFALGNPPPELRHQRIRQFPVQPRPPFMDRLDYMKQIEVPAEIQRDLRPLLDALAAVVPPEAEISGSDRDNFYWSHRHLGDVDWYWVVNDTDRARGAAWRFRTGGRFEKWDAETGERTPWCNGRGLHFGPWDAFFIVRTSGDAGGCPPDPSPEVVLLTLPPIGWRFTPEAREILVPYAETTHSKKLVWLQPERLSNNKWWLIGPFPFDDHRGFYTPYPPEKGFDPNGKYPGAAGEVAWSWWESPTYFVTIREGLRQGNNRGVYYAFAYVYSPSARRGKLLAAFADSMRAWWNGEMRLSLHRHPKWLLMRDSWAERADIDIRQGWNTVLLKIGPSLMVPTAFMFRITAENGETLRDLVCAREQALPPSQPPDEPLTVAIPPGTTGAPPSIDTSRVPEHPIAFRSATVPFTLQSWSDSALAYYSGRATYETEFLLPALPRGKQVFVDLGEVGAAAEVWLNGSPAGERAWRPFRFDVTKLIKPGKNSLKIRVANSDAGWQSQGDTIYPRGSWGLKYLTERDRLATIRPNGLEGPVRIVAR
jgi:hypothetical protein